MRGTSDAQCLVVSVNVEGHDEAMLLSDNGRNPKRPRKLSKTGKPRNQFFFGKLL